MGEHTDFVKVPDLNLAHYGVGHNRWVDPVKLVDDTFVIEFLDDADGFFTDGSFSLLGACTTVMGPVDTRMSSNRMIEAVLCLLSWLTDKYVCANPKIGARF